MRSAFMALVDNEIKQNKKTKKGKIIIKLNSLVDKVMIEKLYSAAKAGVDINLVIRGICCAYPEQKIFKNHMKAISIIDDYLEHARVFIFDNGGKPLVFISSADWMVRNLDHRIEVACPIFNADIQQELIDIMNIQLAENVKGRKLDNEQSNEYVERGAKDPVVRSQVAIYKYLRNKKYID
jgi:polyphosphate kinase